MVPHIKTLRNLTLIIALFVMSAGTAHALTQVTRGLPANVVVRSISLEEMADLDGSGRVDLADLQIVKDNFGGPPPAHPPGSRADVDRSGRVDVRDLALIAMALGRPVPGALPTAEEWQLDLRVIAITPGILGGGDLRIGVKSGCKEPDAATIDDAPGCYSPIPPSFGVTFDDYLDNPGNPDSRLKRLFVSLQPPKSIREWVVVARNLHYQGNLVVTFQWDLTSIPASVDLKLLLPGGAEPVNMRTTSRLDLTLPPSLSSPQFTIRATAR